MLIKIALLNLFLVVTFWWLLLDAIWAVPSQYVLRRFHCTKRVGEGSVSWPYSHISCKWQICLNFLFFSLSLSSFKKEEWRPESVHPESGCQGDGNLSWCSSCHARGVTAATCVACRVLGHSARKLHAFYCWILVEVVCGQILNIVPANSAGFVAVWTRLYT